MQILDGELEMEEVASLIIGWSDGFGNDDIGVVSAVHKRI